MRRPRLAVIAFPGSNCERESLAAATRAGFDAKEFLWNGPVELLRQMDGYFLVGGFSYEDRSRAGVLAAQDPIMDVLREENAKGKGILGVCNGAQILLESGIVGEGTPPPAALGPNLRLSGGHLAGLGFYNAWIRVATFLPPESTLFTRRLASGEVMRIPAAHAEGRFLCDPAQVEGLFANGQAVFQYVDASGKPAGTFPENPNGSDFALAGIGNRAGTALALMPHPERTPAGDPVLLSWCEAISCGWQRPVPVSAHPIRPSGPGRIHLPSGPPPARRIEWRVGSVLTDNSALSVALALRRHGLPVAVQRRVLWQVEVPPHAAGMDDSAILAEGDFYNASKEYLVPEDECAGVCWTVTPHSGMDPEGVSKGELLDAAVPGSARWRVRRGILWTLRGEKGERLPEDWPERVEATRLLFHPLLHEAHRAGPRGEV